MGQLDAKAASSGRATVQSQGAGQPKRLVSLQLFSAKSLAVELHRGADGSFGYKLAPGATEGEDERVSSLPSATSAAGPGARTVVAGSVSVIKASSSTLAASLAPTGASAATLKELSQALSGFSTMPAKVEILKGPHRRRRAAHPLASLGEGKAKQSFWWFAPPTQPEGWFDDQGTPPGGTALADPDAGSASPRPSAIAATTAARPAAASTTASISRARSASRSMPQATA